MRTFNECSETPTSFHFKIVRALSMMVSASTAEKEQTRRWRRHCSSPSGICGKGMRRATDDDPLVRAAEKAHKLTSALRFKRWEAYEFHDRHESYVTVGSFDEMDRLSDGRLLPSTRDAKIVVQTFGAMAPQNVFNRPAVEDLAKEAQVKRQFEALQTQFVAGKAADGFHPKRFVGVPFDIHPAPIEVPQKGTVSTAYVRR